MKGISLIIILGIILLAILGCMVGVVYPKVMAKIDKQKGVDETTPMFYEDGQVKWEDF